MSFNIKEFRRRLGALVVTEQKIASKRGVEAADVVPVIFASLLSLAAYVAKKNMSLSREDFISAATVAAEEEWLGNID